MLISCVPAAFVGVGASIVLLAVVVVANMWQTFLWKTLPPLLSTTGTSPWYVVGVLTFAGIAVGLVVRFVPGHAGPDPATVSLFGPPTALSVLPGLALVLALGGGVSLGPENPIIAIIVGLTVWIGTRTIPSLKSEAWMMLAAAGTIGGDHEPTAGRIGERDQGAQHRSGRGKISLELEGLTLWPLQPLRSFGP